MPAYADIASKEYVDAKIPAVNDATLTIKSNGATTDTAWTANDDTNKEVNIDVSKVRSGGPESTTMANMWLE